MDHMNCRKIHDIQLYRVNSAYIITWSFVTMKLTLLVSSCTKMNVLTFQLCPQTWQRNLKGVTFFLLKSLQIFFARCSDKPKIRTIVSAPEDVLQCWLHYGVFINEVNLNHIGKMHKLPSSTLNN